jgi:hypothetical protein
MKRIIRAAVLSAAAAGITAGSLGLAGAASATSTTHHSNVRVTKASSNGPATVTITTKSGGHYDTTNASGSATFSSPGGPVWAIDNLNETWKITACSANPKCDSADGANYYVTLTTPNSHFAEFANPGPNDPTDGITSTCPSANAGGPRVGTGKVSGTISYSVVANAGPDLTSVPPVQPPATGLSPVLGQIFDNATNFTTVGATPYTFNYTVVCGSVYSQTG